ncbi:acyltransferase [uncultured Selenomonas sp.]|uniref:acyltransferase n=1 Tax=uncultured Selenomonas sp. TaxID=159275 RepID=UPI0025EBBFDB|nr:acyltransferase [uncultured Selenomonas sp.]
MNAKTRKPRLAAIEYIRGISMMGVIGIHVGSQYLGNPAANMHLIALFEIFTRFSVPIFFFISAFGLFYNLDIHAPFDAKHFYKRRIQTVLIPYVVWSLLYLVHDGWLYDTGFPSPWYFCGILFFGVAKYQLYFLVILLWFYFFMPLWIWMIKRMDLKALATLLVFQVAFDYWSSYSVPFNIFVYDLPDDSLLKPILMYRLNYWVLHYIFIFLLGGWLAVHIERFQVFMQTRRTTITVLFWISMASLLAYYYWLLLTQGQTPEGGINTAHQLSPEGIFYTLMASLFFFTIFTYQKYPAALNPILHALGKHSYFAYLVHPFVITYLALALQKSGHLMTGGIAIAFYCAVLGGAMLLAVLFRKLGEALPIINELTIGVYPKKK